MISPVSPLAITLVTSNGGQFELVLANNHGITTTAMVTVSGCRTSSGALMSTLNGTFTATTIGGPNTNRLTVPVGFAGGYSYGGSVWVSGAKVTGATMTGFDSKLATRVTDKTGDTVFGQYALDGNPSIQQLAGSFVRTNATGSKIRSTGTITLGDGDDVVLQPARSRVIQVSCQEVFNPYPANGGTTPEVGAQGPFVYSNLTAIPAAPYTFYAPLTRLHNGAVLESVTLRFFPRATAMPSVFPTLAVYKFNPATDTVLTCLAALGPVAFQPPKTVALYNQTPALGASGSVLVMSDTGGSVSISGGQLLLDSALNTFQVTTGGVYANGASVPVAAVLPGGTAVFLGAETNHAPGDVLTWEPGGDPNLLPSAVVGAGGLAGGLDAGYAQSLVFVPDSGLSLVDQADYAYVAVWTDDDATAQSGAVVGTSQVATRYAALTLSFSGIGSLAPQ